MSEWSLDFTTMFTDYLAGTLLLIGYRAKDWGPLFLVIAWAWTTGMMVGSFSDQLEGTSELPHENFAMMVSSLNLSF